MAKKRSKEKLKYASLWHSASPAWLKGAGVGFLAGFALNFGFSELKECELCHFPSSSQEKAYDALPKSHIRLDKGAFIADYDGRLKQPSWTFHTLTRENLLHEAPALSREDIPFQEDLSLPKEMRSCLQDYKGSGFDRGHLVPARDLSAQPESFVESFKLTNISPQTPDLNRGLLASLEKHARDLAQKFGTIQIITGPLFLPQKGREGLKKISYSVIGANNIAVPTHYFKIIKTPIAEEAYILPNSTLKEEDHFQNYRVSKEDIIKAAGILF